ncbi:hypothetical protein SOMG_01548 [Schizosaccharomyces osmophilus]|uniref:Uncharacterized protein n=1 Tax=Schizosaccharomyces osmophilus TaxID=2545709 RepID=A0AAE9W9Q1_9SCHI|nr:uncharacterized protein SOMG_01548 [Schizosaccharomyces osmophilus]WBW71905.1 hypothetical protein SOMG_01548 [Schizosaccharomyces osmophilus]
MESICDGKTITLHKILSKPAKRIEIKGGGMGWIYKPAKREEKKVETKQKGCVDKSNGNGTEEKADDSSFLNLNLKINK